MTTFVSDREIYERVIRDAVPRAARRLWIATADIKDMYVDSGGREMVPFLAVLDGMVKRGIEVRLIHAKEPGPNWREDFDRYPGLWGGMERVHCPRGRRIPFQIVPAEAQFGDVIWRSRVVFDARIPARGFAIYTLGWDVGKCSQIPNVHKSSLSTNGTNINTNVANVRVLPMPVSNVANAGQDLKLNLDTGNIPTMATLPNASAALREICNGFFSVSAHPGADGIRILRDGRPWLKGAGLQALLFRDPYGSWGTNDPRQYDESVTSVAWRVEHAEVVESGPMRAALWVRLAGERSWLELVLRIAAGRDVIDCEARLLWNERSARLKLSLPCGAAAADCAVPGAVVRRAAALGEVPFVPWARAVDRSGAPVLGFATDALCGLDMARGALRPSVVRASGYAWTPRDGAPMEPWRPATDLGEHRFRFLLAPGTADLPHLAAELLQPPATALAHVSSPGRLGRSGTLVCRENSWRGYDQTLSERKGRNRADRCVLDLAQLKG